MRVRKLLAIAKVQTTDTLWRSDDLPPRHFPVYPKTRPMRAGWQWRSARAEGDGLEFIMTSLVNIVRGDLKSTLIVETPGGYSVVSRYEFHSSHPGLHAHAHCERAGIEVGATGMGDLLRVPPADAKHRHTAPISHSTFWEESRRFFRVKDDLGPLFKS